MKVTKYEHACLDIEHQGRRLLIDPGVFTTSIPNFDNVAAVVVTHVHPDHLDSAKLKLILSSNPSVAIFTVQAVGDELRGSVPVKIVSGGDTAKIGNFNLRFYGGQHALIHKSYPTTDNVGVMVNDKLYYPGDSFTLPDISVPVLAVPASAPWLKIGEAIDFIKEIKATQVFPTHNAVLSEIGMTINNRLLEAATSSEDGTYVNLAPGQSLSL